MAAIPELVSHGETGLLCESGDEACFVSSIEQLLDDPVLRQTMGHAARRHVEERFNPDQCYPRLFELLAEVAACRRRDGRNRRAITSSRGSS